MNSVVWGPATQKKVDPGVSVFKFGKSGSMKPMTYDYGPTPKYAGNYSLGGSDSPVYDPDTSTVPGYTAPTLSAAPKYTGGSYRDMPTYSAPSWNQSEIDALTQQRAAPGLRGLREQVRRVTGANYENPNVKRMTLRDALAGYGSGLSNVMGAASAAAAGEYANKYARTSENARAAYQSEAEKTEDYNKYQEDMAKTAYQGSFAEWQAENAAKEEAAKMDYSGRMKAWETEAEADKLNFGVKAEAAKESRQYKLEQKALDAAWERWKRQQEEMESQGWSGGKGGLS